MMLITDRLAVVLTGFNVEKTDFIKAYAELNRISEQGARNNLNNWLQRRAQPTDVEAIVRTLEHLLPGVDVRRPMLADIGPHELLAACNTTFQTVMGAVSENFRRGMEGADVSAVKQLAGYALAQQDRVQRRLTRLVGRWTMYRRHSAQIGLLRETILVTAVHDCLAVGTYHQFDPASLADPNCGPRPIEISMFYCGDIVFSFGCLAYADNHKIDPVVTSILQRAFNLPPPFNAFHFPGLLLGLADETGVPSAMRVVVRQDATIGEPEPGTPLTGVVTDPEEAAVYGAGVDNALVPNELARHMSFELMARKLRAGWDDAQLLRTAREAGPGPGGAS